jgi:hypothetical protein
VLAALSIGPKTTSGFLRRAGLVAVMTLACGGQVEHTREQTFDPDAGTGGTAAGGGAGSAATAGAAGSSTPPSPERDAGSDRPPILPPTPETTPGPAQPDCYDGGRLGCTGESDSFGFQQRTPEPFLHVVSVYQTHAMHSFSCSPEGVFRVRVLNPGDHVLVLGSYEPAHWVVDLASEVRLLRVLITGYHRAGWSVPEGVAVEDLTYPTTGISSPIAASFPSAEADQLISLAQARTGLTISSLSTAYCHNRVDIR